MRKKKVASVVAKNMNFTSYDKESIAKLIMFSTFLNKRNSAKEILNSLDIISTWKTKISKKIDGISTFRRLKTQGWAEKQDISDYISIAVDLLSKSDFFDIPNKLEADLHQFSTDLMEVRPDATVEEIEQLRYSTKDFSCQYYGINPDGTKRELSECEKHAILMYLINQLSHVFENKYDDPDLNLSESQTTHLIYEFRNLKNWCIHQIIAEKEQGAQVFISLKKDPKVKAYNDVIYIFLPNYFEPFAVHFNADYLSEKERNLCGDEDKYLGSGIRYTIPLYLSDEKKELLREVYLKKFKNNPNATYTRENRLRCFFETEEMFQRKFKIKKLKDSPNNGTKKLKGKSDDIKPINIAEENQETIDELEGTLGIQFPEYFKQGLLKRTSYSIKSFMDAVKGPVMDEFRNRGISEEELDKEFAKLIIHMKVAEQLSTIVIKSASKKSLKAIECIPYYQETYNFICKNLESESEYSKLKSKTKKHLELFDPLEDKTVKEEAKQQIVIQNPDNSLTSLENMANNLTTKLTSLTEKLIELTSELEGTTQQLSQLKTEISKLRESKGQTLQTTTKDDRGEK